MTGTLAIHVVKPTSEDLAPLVNHIRDLAFDRFLNWKALRRLRWKFVHSRKGIVHRKHRHSAQKLNGQPPELT